MVTRIISRGINIFRFSLNISRNISHFTYLLSYFHGSRKKFSLWQKQRNQIQLDNVKKLFLTATVILKTISQAGAINMSHRVALSSYLPTILEKRVNLR